MSLQTPDRVRRLQRTLYVKAKNEPAYRFYLLYDKVCRGDVLEHAYRVSRAARGARTHGVDGTTFDDIETTGRPIFEADFEDGAYGYRPKRSAQDAVQAVHDALCGRLHGRGRR